MIRSVNQQSRCNTSRSMPKGLVTCGMVVEQTGQGVAARQSSVTATERRIHLRPSFARSFRNWAGAVGWPFAMAGAVGIGPRQDLRFGKSWKTERMSDPPLLFEEPGEGSAAGQAATASAERRRDDTPILASSPGHWLRRVFSASYRSAHDRRRPSPESEQQRRWKILFISDAAPFGQKLRLPTTHQVDRDRRA